MTIDHVLDVAKRAALKSATAEGAATGGGSERERLKAVAAEFESMLLVQMLREMRRAGSWEEESENKGLGAEAFLETIDVELAVRLAKAQGFGLGKQMLDALDAGTGTAAQPTAFDAIVQVARPVGHPEPPVVRSPLVPPADRAIEPADDGDALEHPVPDALVTSRFGWRRDPFHGGVRFHRGVDVRAVYGQEIQAAGPGQVVFSGTQGGYGTTVVIEHDNGLRTRYAHLSAALVRAGERIESGQVLGRAGDSGRATGAHLHFEVTDDGRPVDPLAMLGRPESGAKRTIVADTVQVAQHTLSGLLKVSAGLADSTVGETGLTPARGDHDED